MSHQVFIHSLPNFCFFDVDKPSSPDLSFQSLIDVTDIITALSQSNGEVANITVNIENIDGYFTQFIYSWFNAYTEYFSNGVKVFGGHIATIKSGDTLQLTVVA